MVFLFYILMHFKRKVLFRESPQFLPSNRKLLNCLTYCRTSVQSQTETGETSSPVGSEFQKMGRKKLSSSGQWTTTVIFNMTNLGTNQPFQVNLTG